MTPKPILIIEDERDARETLQQLLELEGFAATTAENGAEGLKVLDTVKRPCLILLDLMMPVMNGWQFLEALASKHKELLDTVPVVIVSAAADVDDVRGTLGCEVIRKPLDLDRLLLLARTHCTCS